MSRRILITSGKGGVGKTSVSAYLGYALSKQGERVVIIDMDMGLNNLDAVMGVESKVVYDLKDVLDGKCRVKETLIECSPTLYVIPSRHSFDKSVTGKNVRDLTEGLKTRFDYILLDSPAGVGSGFHRAALAADEAILVVTPSLTSLRDGDKVIGLLSNYTLKSISVVVNRVRGDLVLSGAAVDAEEISSVLKVPVIGCIPDDDSILLGESIKTCSPRAYKSFKMLARYVRRGKGKVFDTTSYYRGLYGAIRRNLRGKL